MFECFRHLFSPRDVVIDLVGYRKFGHNEIDEPMFTQPIMYSIIKKHKNILELYSEKLITDGVVTKEETKAVVDKYFSKSVGQLSVVNSSGKRLQQVLFHVNHVWKSVDNSFGKQNSKGHSPFLETNTYEELEKTKRSARRSYLASQYSADGKKLV